jgi:RimJ/RimL family protein N-acetyltransferase
MTNLWTQTPTFTGTHVTLRPLVPEDRNAIIAAASDGKLWELFYTVVPGPDTVDAWLASAFRDQGHGRALPFAVLDKDGTLIGSTRYMRMAPENRRLEIGSTFYAARTQRTPVNTETKLLLLRHAFEAMDCVCVQIRTDFLNRQSQRAIERLGAKKDGVIRGHRIMADGRVRDMVVYSILAHEWGGVRSNLEMMLSRGFKQ